VGFFKEPIRPARSNRWTTGILCVTIRRILQVHSEPEAEGRRPMTQIFVTPMTIIFEQIDLDLPNWHDNPLDEAWQWLITHHPQSTMGRRV